MSVLSSSIHRIATEAQEQSALFEWADKQQGKYPELRWMHAIKNGGSLKGGEREGKRLKEQGVKAGVADVFLPCARGRYHGLYIEMKRVRDSRTSAEQIKFKYDMNEQGYLAHICYGWEQAADKILHYFQLPKWLG